MIVKCWSNINGTVVEFQVIFVFYFDLRRVWKSAPLLGIQMVMSAVNYSTVDKIISC